MEMNFIRHRSAFMLGIAAFIILLFGQTAMAIEKLPYTLIEKENEFELRQYGAHIVAETVVQGTFKDVGNEGFRRLFRYISGDNRMKQEIPMTAPVSQEASSGKIPMTAPVNQERIGEKWRISFIMPSKYTAETLPDPLDDRVKLLEVPPRLMAAVRYSGTWSREHYERNKKRLEDWIQDNGLASIGAPVFSRYNPPYMPWLLRRNEVLIPVEKSSI
jgi:effector-binding domain-containing protein